MGSGAIAAHYGLGPDELFVQVYCDDTCQGQARETSYWRHVPKCRKAIRNGKITVFFQSGQEPDTVVQRNFVSCITDEVFCVSKSNGGQIISGQDLKLVPSQASGVGQPGWYLLRLFIGLDDGSATFPFSNQIGEIGFAIMSKSFAEAGPRCDAVVHIQKACDVSRQLASKCRRAGTTDRLPGIEDFCRIDDAPRATIGRISIGPLENDKIHGLQWRRRIRSIFVWCEPCSS